MNTSTSRHTFTHLSFHFIAQGLSGACKLILPQKMFRNPILFAIYIGAIISSLYTLYSALDPYQAIYNQNIPPHLKLYFLCTVSMWLILFFSNFATALTATLGKAQATSLRRLQVETRVLRIQGDTQETISSVDLKQGDIIVCSAGEIIPANGKVIEGTAAVDESAITGESAPVIRESGGERNQVTAGSRVLSDYLKIQILEPYEDSFLSHISTLTESTNYQKTPSEINISTFITAFSITQMVILSSLYFFCFYNGAGSIADLSLPLNLPILLGATVALLPTTIIGLLNPIGINGTWRLILKNMLPKSSSAIEAAANIDLLLIDKTGTLTLGNRTAHKLLPLKGIQERDLAAIAQLSSLGDDTLEGKSIVTFTKNNYDLLIPSLEKDQFSVIPFSSQTRISGIDVYIDKNTTKRLRKGSLDAIEAYIWNQEGQIPEELYSITSEVSLSGGTALVVCEDSQVIGAIYLKDKLKGGIKDRLAHLRSMGIASIMITGDSPISAATVAAEIGVDDFIAQATPEKKLAFIRRKQAEGNLVAMVGDETNDAPALAQADVGIAMLTGTQTSKEAGNIIDLESNPSKLLDLVVTAKELLMTRGCILLFTLSSEFGKYLVCIPALLANYTYTSENQSSPAQLFSLFNPLSLSSPSNAIVSSLIFNALILVVMTPVALNGVKFRLQSPVSMLRNNIIVFGIGGLFVSIIGIKLIDMILSSLRGGL